ncbi:MAG: hypothetical protein AAGF12_36005 [Myxococcota bacterium]
MINTMESTIDVSTTPTVFGEAWKIVYGALIVPTDRLINVG